MHHLRQPRRSWRGGGIPHHGSSYVRTREKKPSMDFFFSGHPQRDGGGGKINKKKKADGRHEQATTPRSGGHPRGVTDGPAGGGSEIGTQGFLNIPLIAVATNCKEYGGPSIEEATNKVGALLWGRAVLHLRGRIRNCIRNLSVRWIKSSDLRTNIYINQANQERLIGWNDGDMSGALHEYFAKVEQITQCVPHDGEECDVDGNASNGEESGNGGVDFNDAFASNGEKSGNGGPDLNDSFAYSSANSSRDDGGNNIGVSDVEDGKDERNNDISEKSEKGGEGGGGGSSNVDDEAEGNNNGNLGGDVGVNGSEDGGSNDGGNDRSGSDSRREDGDGSTEDSSSINYNNCIGENDDSEDGGSSSSTDGSSGNSSHGDNNSDEDGGDNAGSDGEGDGSLNVGDQVLVDREDGSVDRATLGKKMEKFDRWRVTLLEGVGEMLEIPTSRIRRASRLTRSSRREKSRQLPPP